MCHQTVGLVARHLEARGLPTVILGSALDVIEHCGVPRFLFVDFPLGNPCGEPYRPDLQRLVVGLALDLLASASGPRTTVRAPFEWSGGHDWRARYMYVDPVDRERLARAGEQRRAQRERDRVEGRARGD